MRSKLILPVIIISQFCCTSLWFASNGIITDLIINYNLKAAALGHLTSAVQIGFIFGTLSFAIFTIADRFSPSKVFFICSIIGALFNVAIAFKSNTYVSLLFLRFLTGFFLAGIYPIGMKIAADYFEKGLGKSLGFLVGALVIGTAFPHLLKSITETISWKLVLVATSSLALFGGVLMLLLVPDGPYRKAGKKLNFSAFFRVFRNPEFRSSAYGYFGHMWELYAFWTFVPIILTSYKARYTQFDFNISIWSFIIIAVGGLACIIGGYLSQKLGTKQTVFLSLFFSFVCCLISPLIISIESDLVFLSFLVFWGMVVIADSPLLSTLVAKNAPNEITGTALTIVNCIGFSVTIVSIQLISKIQSLTDSNAIYMLLGIGPLIGLIAISIKNKNSTQ